MSRKAGNLMREEPLGICPNCDMERVRVAKRCPMPGCSKKGYHFIPEPWLRYSLQFAARSGRLVSQMLDLCIEKISS